MELWRVWLARLFGVGCLALGIIGVIVGFGDGWIWKLGTVGWFTGGILLGVVALLLLADECLEQQRRGGVAE